MRDHFSRACASIVRGNSNQSLRNRAQTNKGQICHHRLRHCHRVCSSQIRDTDPPATVAVGIETVCASPKETLFSRHPFDIFPSRKVLTVPTSNHVLTERIGGDLARQLVCITILLSEEQYSLAFTCQICELMAPQHLNSVILMGLNTVLFSAF